MTYPAVKDIVETLGNLVDATSGPMDVIVRGVASLDDASVGDVTFMRSSDGLAKLQHGRYPSAVILPPSLSHENLSQSGVAVIVSSNPRLAFMRTVRDFFPPKRPFAGIHATAIIDAGANIHPTATIGPYCYVCEGSSVSEGTVLFPHVTVCCPSKIGRNVTIHSGTVIGADGFGYERNEAGELEAFPHIGGVVIEDDVEIGANTCIDRGTLGNTIICKGARVDNLVHIAHNVRIGARSAVIANSMLGGSVEIGEEAWIAPSATLLNKLKIGAKSTVGIGSLVTKNVADGEVVLGAPAMAIEQFKKLRHALMRLI
jgi:UDP-3-O-[3-hydroxymyristoyl] glucosamine N-acyltransferase